MFVEGSLTSVTASSRALHTNHHLGRKKVSMLRGRVFSTLIMVMCSASTGVIQLMVTWSNV
jgi:hypothetical protein